MVADVVVAAVVDDGEYDFK